MRQYYGFAATALVAVTLAAAACDNGPKHPVDTGLCGQPGSTRECPVATDSAYFTITLVSTSCVAKGTTITVTSPVSDKLTGDACYQSVPKTWTIGSASAGFPPNTQVNFTIISDQTANPPGFHVAGTYPDWNITFEDGGDTDYNDVVLNVHATAIN
ncbi:MAG TPA: hypothetical protein VFN83_03215 [Gemmatimonadales bacterium]|jgi:hypothetical protein|nr:hypothetical protein [Gemmatimonadales bacterium]